MAEFIKLYEENPNPRDIQKVVSVLKRGGLIIYPTDTVYGLGCDITNIKALERIARIKGIKLEKSNFSFVCEDLSNLSDYVKQIDTSTFKILKRALPGAYTFILPGAKTLPNPFKKRKTVGIRVPDNAIALEIVKELGNPIVSTSIRDDDEIIEPKPDLRKTFIPDDIVKQDLQRYIEAINQFCSTAKVHEFFQAWPFRMKNQKPKEANVRKIVAKTDYSWEQCTLQDVKETTNFIAQLLSISRPFLPVRNVEEGCVSIHWYIPPSVAAHVESLEVQPDSMTKHRLLSITIDSVQIYPFTPATRKVSLRLKEFYKSKHSTTKLDLMQPFKLALIKKEIYGDFKFISNNKTQVEKLFMIIKDLKEENNQFQKII